MTGRSNVRQLTQHREAKTSCRYALGGKLGLSSLQRYELWCKCLGSKEAGACIDLFLGKQSLGGKTSIDRSLGCASPFLATLSQTESTLIGTLRQEQWGPGEPRLPEMLENGWGSLSSSTKPNQVQRIAILGSLSARLYTEQEGLYLKYISSIEYFIIYKV